jgi:hypothetical protein
MPLPLSGQISFADIATEFNDSAPHAIDEFYRGGVRVPNIQANISIPTVAGSDISLSNFYGAANLTALNINVTKAYLQVVEDPKLGWYDNYTGYLNSAQSPSATTVGARSPTSVNGATILGIYFLQDYFGIYSFNIILAGIQTQTFFHSINNADAAIGTRLTSAAAFSAAGGNSYWNWNLVDNANTWNGVTGSATVTFYY